MKTESFQTKVSECESAGKERRFGCAGSRRIEARKIPITPFIQSGGKKIGMFMGDKIQQVLTRGKVLKMKAMGSSEKETSETAGISIKTVSRITKILAPRVEKNADELMDFYIDQKIQLSKVRFAIFKKVLGLPITDENFYRQLRAAAESAKEENEALLMLHKIKGNETKEVREDVWGAVLKRLEEREIELRGESGGSEEIENGGGERSERIESNGNEGKVLEESQQ